MSTAAQQKRYPGVKPFETAERDLFFGRARDIEDLLDLVWLEKLVVLFGKSGYGKSSLINAGLLPEIEREAISIVVRFGAYVEGQTLARLDNLRDRINDAVPNNPDAVFLDDLNLPESLWLLVKRKQSPKQRCFVLIFDQFEEFFTYPKSVQQAFKEQLAELLYTEVPQAARDRTDSLSAEQQAFIATPFDAKVLFAIRSDRMSLLDSMKDKLPSILQKRYELRGLSEVQAREAIERPAQREGHFASPTFAYSPEALRAMTQKLAETKSAQRSGIETFQLQILCEYLEDKVIKGEIPNNRIEPQHFADNIDEVFEGYYQRFLDRLDPSGRQAAQLLIEEGLVFSDIQTGESRRLSMDADMLLQRYATNGITEITLRKLESTFLLRREANTVGGFNYEISHDSLLPSIIKLKSKRQIAEVADKKKKKLSYIFIAILFISIFFALIASISNKSTTNWGGGNKIYEIKIDKYKSIEILIDTTKKFITKKYSKGNCDGYTEIINELRMDNNIYFSISNLRGEIIPNDQSFVCNLIKPSNDPCFCLKRERIDVRFSFDYTDSMTRVRIEISAKYASGFYKNVRNAGYIDIGNDYSDYFEEYAFKFFNEYNYILNK